MTSIQTFGAESILALRERWSPIPKRAGYAVGMGTLLLAVILMPLLYFGALAGVGYGVYWALVNLSPGETGLGGVGGLALWLVPAFVGMVLALFLLKPLLAPGMYREEPYVLNASEEPRLFAFIHAVCDVIGAPAPSEVAVDCTVNASAGFRGGWLSLLRRDDLTLTIGMPLVAGMSKREFAGVLAHEFGHFAQGSGMRLTYASQRIAHWFARAAWERDGWDEALLVAQRELGLLGILVMLLRVCIGAARLVLKLVFMLSMSICTFVLRQMEFDADRYQVQLVGARAMISASRRLEDLLLALPRAEDRARQMFRREMKVPDNFPALVAAAAERITPEAREELKRRSEGDLGVLGRLFSTHPSWATRRAQAEVLEQGGWKGLLEDDEAASGLFSDFNSACIKASYGHYKARIGRAFEDVTFVPTAPGVSGHASGAESAGSAGGRLAGYVGFEPPSWRPLFPGFVSIPEGGDGKRLMAKLKDARTRLQKLAPQAAAQTEVFRTCSEEARRWEAVKFLFEHNLKVEFRKLGLKVGSRAGVSHRIDDLREKSATAAMTVDEALEAGQARLRAALGFLGMRGVERLVADAARQRARAEELLAMLHALEQTQRFAREVRDNLARMEAVSCSIRNKATYDQAMKAFRPVSDRVRDLLEDARRDAGAVIYPYPSEVPEQTLGARIVGASPGWRNFEEIIEAASRFVDAWPDEQRRAVNELIGIAVRVEGALAKAAKARAAGG